VSLSNTDKIRLLRELTRGPDDVFAMRTDKKAGWSWRPVYAPLPDKFVAMHLAGHVEIGSYALIPFGNGKPPNIWWIAADFDGKKEYVDWERDVKRVTAFLYDTGAPLFVNLSRSAQGAHVRVLFNEPVPAWMARRWMNAWLEEAGVILPDDEEDDLDDGAPQSFDRVIPPQDFLSGRLNDDGNRMPGNLVGSPLNKKCMDANGGSTPLDPAQAALGNFKPDGKHWEHVVAALEHRTWGVAELKEALKDAPGSPITTTPEFNGSYGSPNFRLPVIQGSSRQLEYVSAFCEFMRHMRNPNNQSYQLWVALATELHRFGEDGRAVFHEISRAHRDYRPTDTDEKWKETAVMRPVRCDTLVNWGYRCPHLHTPRCAGAKAPTYFADHTDAEIL
jgi:hypothetical protein